MVVRTQRNLLSRLGLAVFAVVAPFGAVGAKASDPPALVPRPASVCWAGGRLPLRRPLRVVVPAHAPAGLAEVAGLLVEELRDQCGVRAEVANANSVLAGDIGLRLVPAGAGRDPEAYVLSISDAIAIAASDPAGLRWGAQTLLQCIEDAPAAPWVPKGRIDDRPAYPWRAVLLDPARVYLDPAFLRQTVRVMSAYKLNVLHLHLTDDQGWRFETRLFPRCNPSDGLFYPQAELKDLVAYAARRGVQIVPEFDLPGHARAAVAAYPELDCGGKVPQAAGEAILCPAKRFTWDFIDGIVGEAARVFPSPYLDLGADEPFAISRWAWSPDCRREMRMEGLTSLAAYYHGFLIELDALVRRHGRKLIVWNDAVHPGVEPMPPRDIIIDAWTNYPNARALSADGYRIINSSQEPLYLSSFGRGAGSGLDDVERWAPTLFGVRPERDGRWGYGPLAPGAAILGGQASAWATEQVLVERRLYPRVLAVADTLWSGTRAGNVAEAEARIAASQAIVFRRLGIPSQTAAHARALLSGTALDGWTAVGGARFFRVGDVLAASAGGGWIRTQAVQRDFMLDFDERIPPHAGTTGLYVRCPPEAPAAARPAGYGIGLGAPPGWALMRALRNLRGWHRFEVVARGRVLSLTIDGILAWSIADPIEKAGAIALDPPGPGFEFRNLDLQAL